MKKLVSAIALSLGVLGSGAAMAATFDFYAMANGSPGEGAFTGATVGGITLTVGAGSSQTATGYLDEDYAGLGGGGLGVCNDFFSSGACKPSSDDNVTTREYLELSFDKGVTIKSISFNNNHDGGWGGDGEGVYIGATFYPFPATSSPDWYELSGPFVLGAGKILKIAYADDVENCSIDVNHCEFYISQMEVAEVPLPGTLGLLGLGLAGLGAVRRRK